MGIVIGDFLIVLAVVSLIVMLVLKSSAKKDAAQSADAARRERTREAEARAEARKYREGEPLICLNCEHQFLGPLTEAGCPRCLRASLVITLAQYRERDDQTKQQFHLDA